MRVCRPGMLQPEYIVLLNARKHHRISTFRRIHSTRKGDNLRVHNLDPNFGSLFFIQTKKIEVQMNINRCLLKECLVYSSNKLFSLSFSESRISSFTFYTKYMRKSTWKPIKTNEGALGKYRKSHLSRVSFLRRLFISYMKFYGECTKIGMKNQKSVLL